jgi:5-hydroxyisourate hydrolase
MTISTQIFDTAQGVPAAQVEVSLAYLQPNGKWLDLGTGPTDEKGYIAELAPRSFEVCAGMYRVSYATSHYFAFSGMRSIWPMIPVIFELTDITRSYHIQLLLSPYGYSTVCEFQ